MSIICIDGLKVYLLGFRIGVLLTGEPIKPNSWLEFETENIKCRITRRPKYCDRGRFLWRAQSKDITVLNIDDADRFPRYFFNMEALIMEIESLLNARNQKSIIRIEIKDMESSSNSEGADHD